MYGEIAETGQKTLRKNIIFSGILVSRAEKQFIVNY
jgi:hypothetical protein